MGANTLIPGSDFGKAVLFDEMCSASLTVELGITFTGIFLFTAGLTGMLAT
jgi:hypothetical protein